MTYVFRQHCISWFRAPLAVFPCLESFGLTRLLLRVCSPPPCVSVDVTRLAVDVPRTQDLTGGLPVRITSPMPGSEDLPLWGMQIDLEQARQELQQVGRVGGREGGR